MRNSLGNQNELGSKERVLTIGEMGFLVFFKAGAAAKELNGLAPLA